MAAKTMKTTFQGIWLQEPDFASWLGRIETKPGCAYCSVCACEISLSNMGKQALRSHIKSKKHSQRTGAGNMFKYLTHKSRTELEPGDSKNVGSNGTTEQPNTAEPHVAQIQSFPPMSNLSSGSRTVDKFMLNNDTTKAEILWCLETIMSHKSLRAAEKDMVVLKKMFHDSQIAEKVQLGRDKIRYMMMFGIAPYYKSVLDETLHSTRFIVVGFDESLNKTTKKQQMDINVRFWDENKNEIVTRYLTSMFLGRSRALDLLAAFKEGLGSIPLNKLLQVSMDGPNVNWAFLRELKLDVQNGDEKMLDLGSCGLHILHGAFKDGIRCTSWDIIKYLRGIYNIFKDVPARRAMFTSYSESTIFPLKFCAHRWLENVDVAQRAIEITPHIGKFIEGVQKDKLEPTSDSYHDVVKCLQDPLLMAKLAFFKSVAAEVEPFLREFQTDSPMVPFLYNALSRMVRGIMERFMKIDQLNNITQVTTDDVNDIKNHLPAKEIVLGFDTKKAIKNSPKLNEKQDLQFRLECKAMLKALVLKLMKRSPLTYPMTKAASCLDPSVIKADQKLARKQFEKLLTILIVCGRISGVSADLAVKEYYEIISNGKSGKFEAYERKSERLDHFWNKLTGDKFKELFSIVKMICCLSHGNANVERGFSINAECLYENMREESVVAKRQIYDAVFHAGGISSIEISNKLIQRVRNSHSLYLEDKGRRKKEALESDKEKLKKRQREAEAKSLEAKRRKILEDAQKEAESLQEKIFVLKS